MAFGLVSAEDAPSRAIWRDMLKAELVLFESDYSGSWERLQWVMEAGYAYLWLSSSGATRMLPPCQQPRTAHLCAAAMCETFVATYTHQSSVLSASPADEPPPFGGPLLPAETLLYGGESISMVRAPDGVKWQ